MALFHPVGRLRWQGGFRSRASGRRCRLPAHVPRARGLVPGRADLSRVPCSPSLAGWLRLPALPGDGGVEALARPLALRLQHALGLGSYETAWAMLHKLRRAMVRPDRDKLSGEIEVDESYIGGVAAGKPGRGAEKKAIVAIAVEKRGRGMGRIRLARITDTSADSLLPFIEEAIEAGSVVYTDGHKGYKPLARAGYLHEPTSIWTTGDPGHVAMPRVHRVSSLLKRWLLGTHQGAVRPQQLDYYLDEFTFRFNRRSSNHRGLLFYRLLEQAVQLEHVPLVAIVGGRSL